MIGYEITANKQDIAEAVSLFEFVGGNTSDAMRIAINKAAPRVRTKASSAIRSQVRLKAAYVRERLTIKKATRSNLSGAIKTPSRGLLLTRYSTDSLISGDKVGWLKPPPVPPRGIKVKVKPTGSPETFPNEFFYMVLPNSRQLAIARRRTAAEVTAAQAAGKGPGSKGGKVDVKYGPSLSQVFNTVRDDVLPESSDIYQQELLNAMSFVLRKQFPKE